MSDPITSVAALELYDASFVLDAHAGIFPDAEVDLTLLEVWRRAGVQYLSINVGFDVQDWQQVISTLTAYRRFVISNPDAYVLAGHPDDIAHAAKHAKLAISFDIEGMNALNGDVNMVDLYHAMGVRQMLFAYNLGNSAAGGCHDENVGLSDFGREVVERMNEIGVLVDCSHVSHRTSMELIEASTKPVVFSHSNPCGIWRHQRNIEDDQIIACAKTGGVIGINGMGIFLGENDISSETVARHILYLCDLVGPEHVGFGLDYSPQIDIDVGDILRARPDYWPPGNLYDTPKIGHVSPAQLPRVVDLLLDQGYADDDIRGMLGLNFRRVIEAAWS